MFITDLSRAKIHNVSFQSVSTVSTQALVFKNVNKWGEKKKLKMNQTERKVKSGQERKTSLGIKHDEKKTSAVVSEDSY